MNCDSNNTSITGTASTLITDSSASTVNANRSQSGFSIASSTARSTSTTCSCADQKCSQCTATLSSVSTLSAGASASTYDTSVARLKISKNVISQLEKLVVPKPKPKHSLEDPDAPTRGMRIRFYACVMTLITIGGATVLANATAINREYITGVFVAFSIFFTVHWNLLYGRGLSRARRAYFDEKNVLETYLVYDRKFGHFFHKDPDTPGQPTCCDAPPGAKSGEVITGIGNDPIAQYKATAQEQIEFANENVQNHYGGMYDNIKRVNAELDLLAKGDKANENFKSPLVINTTLVPANLPIPGVKDSKKSSSK